MNSIDVLLALASSLAGAPDKLSKTVVSLTLSVLRSGSECNGLLVVEPVDSVFVACGTILEAGLAFDLSCSKKQSLVKKPMVMGRIPPLILSRWAKPP